MIKKSESQIGEVIPKPPKFPKLMLLDELINTLSAEGREVVEGRYIEIQTNIAELNKKIIEHSGHHCCLLKIVSDKTYVVVTAEDLKIAYPVEIHYGRGEKKVTLLNDDEVSYIKENISNLTSFKLAEKFGHKRRTGDNDLYF